MLLVFIFSASTASQQVQRVGEPSAHSNNCIRTTNRFGKEALNKGQGKEGKEKEEEQKREREEEKRRRGREERKRRKGKRKKSRREGKAEKEKEKENQCFFFSNFFFPLFLSL